MNKQAFCLALIQELIRAGGISMADATKQALEAWEAIAQAERLPQDTDDKA